MINNKIYFSKQELLKLKGKGFDVANNVNWCVYILESDENNYVYLDIIWKPSSSILEITTVYTTLKNIIEDKPEFIKRSKEIPFTMVWWMIFQLIFELKAEVKFRINNFLAFEGEDD